MRVNAWDVCPTVCPICGLENCEDHVPPDPAAPRELDPAFLSDAIPVIREGKQIAG